MQRSTTRRAARTAAGGRAGRRGRRGTIPTGQHVLMVPRCSAGSRGTSTLRMILREGPKRSRRIRDPSSRLNLPILPWSRNTYSITGHPHLHPRGHTAGRSVQGKPCLLHHHRGLRRPGVQHGVVQGAVSLLPVLHPDVQVAHDGPVTTVTRSPFFSDLVLTVRPPPLLRCPGGRLPAGGLAGDRAPAASDSQE